MTGSPTETLLVLLAVATLLGIGIGVGLRGALARRSVVAAPADVVPESTQPPENEAGAHESMPKPDGTGAELEAVRATLEHERARRVDVQNALEAHLAERDDVQAHVRLQARRIALLEAELVAADESIARLRNRLGERPERRASRPESSSDAPPRLLERHDAS